MYVSIKGTNVSGVDTPLVYFQVSFVLQVPVRPRHRHFYSEGCYGVGGGHPIVQQVCETCLCSRTDYNRKNKTNRTDYRTWPRTFPHQLSRTDFNGDPSSPRGTLTTPLEGVVGLTRGVADLPHEEQLKTLHVFNTSMPIPRR